MGLLKILYRDEYLVAIDKPESLLVHRSRISRDHVFALQLLRDQMGQFVYPAHRLDRATSGVLLFALSSESASVISALFAERKIKKEYIAVARGVVDKSGTIDYPLREEGKEKVQEAVTTYSRLDEVELPFAVGKYATSRYSLVRITPHTGRTHQIRRHFKHIAHPLIGDTTHGKGAHNRFFREQYQMYRLLLHARELSFIHPITEQPLVIQAPVPEEMALLFAKFGWVCPGIGC